MENLTLLNNSGFYGGGIYCLDASPCITNCLIYANTTQNGAGIENKLSSPTYTNTTIAMNLASDYGGGMNNYLNSNPTFNNCIFWENNATNGDQIYISGNGTVTLNHSCYSNNEGDVVTASISDIFVATNNNITVEPIFVNSANGDFRIFGNSIAVNNGGNSYNTLATDIRGEARIQNSTIDMGAYEWTSALDPGCNVFSWTGALSNDWDTPGNWSENVVPSLTCLVSIPETSNDPIVSSCPEHPAECCLLTIQNGAVLSVAAGKALSVTALLNNEAGSPGLVLKSDATATASLIHNSSGVDATVERYIPKYENTAGWHYLSSPVVQQAIQPNFVASPPDPDEDFYKFSEQQYNWINVKDNSGNWDPSFEDNFVVGRGYNVAYDNNETKEFEGELNTGDFSFDGIITPAITYTADGGCGWNLIGNPYPSGLDWDECQRTNIDGSVYVFDGDAGQYLCWNGCVGGLDGGIIPPTNGFFIKASENPGLTIPNSARVHSSCTFYKSKDVVEDVLVLKVDGNGFSDHTFIHMNPEASNGFDKDCDAYKLSGIAAAPQLYTKTGKTKLNINEQPYSTEEIMIPLGLKVDKDGNYTISVRQNTFWESVSISLKDLETQITYNLITNKSITINHSPDNSPDRFLLLINGATTIGENTPDSSIEIYAYGNQVFIKTDEAGTVEAGVYNLLGQRVIYQVLSGAGNLTGLKTGTYIITAKTNNAIRTKKIFIQ